MARDGISPLRRLLLRAAATDLGTRCLVPIQPFLDRQVLKLTDNRFSLTGLIAGLPVVLLTTTGAKTGLPRTQPLLCFRDPERPHTFAVVGSNYGQKRNPAWYYNLKAHPRAIGSIAGRRRTYLSHEANDVEYRRFWQIATDSYPGFTRYAEKAGDRHIAIMVLEPDA